MPFIIASSELEIDPKNLTLVTFFELIVSIWIEEDIELKRFQSELEKLMFLRTRELSKDTKIKSIS